MANNKVQLADGTTLIDLTEDTVTPQTMLAGTTAHAASGEQITGVVNLANAGDSVPLADSGSGAVGSSTDYARKDHVHPLIPSTLYTNFTFPSGFSLEAGGYQRIGDLIIVNICLLALSDISNIAGQFIINNLPAAKVYNNDGIGSATVSGAPHTDAINNHAYPILAYSNRTGIYTYNLPITPIAKDTRLYISCVYIGA